MENVLGQETSPYLLQHADNPVHWQPWRPETFARAKAENKPILLSVGYAACHWCHVMAHESFEDAATAELMNALFVNIKVDREERPDVDAIYQTALALLGEHGGWPLTMFLTPDGAPFWGGTYFPPEARYGRPAFSTVLKKVAEVWREKAEMVDKNVEVMRAALERTATPTAGDQIPPDFLIRLGRELAREIDPVHGGIGRAPKFPHVPGLKLVLRAHLRSGDPKLGEAVRLTLRQMSQGGIYDHLGGGYARYATDALWLVPHFEKMLYDNAQLIDVLLQAWTVYNDRLFSDRIKETADWLIRDMTAPDGAFAATLDADSEGEEGRYYVWTAAEVDAALGDAAEPFKQAYGVHPAGNWEGKTILNRLGNPELLDDATEQKLAQARAVLLELREKRVPPARDDKVLADWNGLAIAALARAGAVFDRPDWTAAAVQAFDFVSTTMTLSDADADDGQKRLVHSYRAGQTGSIATLDDYAAMARAALVLYQTEGESRYLEAAEGWVEVLEAHYRDRDGAFFFTADDATDLIVRTKSAHDGPTPAGNGLMVGVFARLWLLTGEERYRQRAEEIIGAFTGALEKESLGMATMIAESELLHRAAQTVIIGTPEDAATKELFAAALRAPQPNLVLQRIDPDAELPKTHPAHGKKQEGGKATAYVCVGPVCSLPLTDAEGLRDALTES